ncbi:hypothetical protein D3C75_529550 [compost metagenome]
MITAHQFPALAMHSRKRYGLSVAAKSVTDLGGSMSKRRNSAPITIAGAFFVPAFSCYGGLRRSTLGCAGLLVRRSANPVQSATLICLAADRGGSSVQGALPMKHTLIPSSNSLAIAIIGAELIAYRINRLPEQRAHLLGLVQMADTLGALSKTDRATLASSLPVGEV